MTERLFSPPASDLDAVVAALSHIRSPLITQETALCVCCVEDAEALQRRVRWRLGKAVRA